MPLYTQLHTGDGGRAIAVVPVPPASVSTPTERPPSSGARGADPGRPSGAGDRRGPVARGLVLVAALAGFALLMSVLTGPGTPAAGHEHAGHVGPVAGDFLAIGVAPVVAGVPVPGPGASTGSFTARCGRNEGGHRNSDNFITAPGRGNGAHHVHDYVGNTSTDGGSTDRSLAAASTTCAGGDRSVYFWPVLRDLRHPGPDADRPGGGSDGNLGRILTPAAVELQFLGNPREKVQAMPRFLRMATGDAKAVTKGPGAARAHWSCSGTPDRASATHYPLCPAGQLVQRVGEFPSCWNGTDLDSATHRSHVSFPDPGSGACPAGTRPIPRLQITLSYQVPAGRSYAIDTFPDQARKPVTDHFDFENLMPDTLMNHAVDCINTGRIC